MSDQPLLPSNPATKLLVAAGTAVLLGWGGWVTSELLTIDAQFNETVGRFEAVIQERASVFSEIQDDLNSMQDRQIEIIKMLNTHDGQ